MEERTLLKSLIQRESRPLFLGYHNRIPGNNIKNNTENLNKDNNGMVRDNRLSYVSLQGYNINKASLSNISNERIKKI